MKASNSKRHCSYLRLCLKAALFISISMLFLACGGGSSSSSSDGGSNNPPLPGAPVADAGVDMGAVQGDTVQLDGSGSQGDPSIAEYQWTQIGGTTVALTQADQAIASFTAPDVLEDLRFRLTITDAGGDQDTDDVTVHCGRLLYSNNFSGTLTGWQAVDDSGTTSDWALDTGRLIQRNLVEFMENPPGSFDESFHRGTYLHYTPGSSWSDYRFSVQIQPIADGSLPSGSQDGNDVGVMFRYADNDSYYRLSLSASQGFTRLEKKTGAGFATLAVDARGYVENQQLYVTVVANGATLAVYLNDEPLFAYEDPSPILQGSVALYCQDRALFDDVRVTDAYEMPEIVIREPFDFSVSPTTGNQLTVDLSPTFFSSGDSIAITLAGQTQVLTGAPFQAAFNNVAPGNQTITAVLRDADDRELSRDVNDLVGVDGKYYLTVGDSITNGKADGNPNNNISADGRIVSKQGYQAHLSDLLTADLNEPVILFNEGVGGDKVLDTYNERITSILERHPNGDRVLLLLGTNDSFSVTAATFDTQMRTLVNYITGTGRRLWIAKILPVYNSDGTLNTTRSNRIIEYNQKIDAIVSATGDNIFAGPDLYAVFIDKYSQYYSTGGIHPNDAGYQAMAEAWFDALSANP